MSLSNLLVDFLKFKAKSLLANRFLWKMIAFWKPFSFFSNFFFQFYAFLLIRISIQSFKHISLLLIVQQQWRFQHSVETTSLKSIKTWIFFLFILQNVCFTPELGWMLLEHELKMINGLRSFHRYYPTGILINYDIQWFYAKHKLTFKIFPIN